MNSFPQDYRLSHQGKGEDYDRALQEGDFNTYMAKLEAKIVCESVRKIFPAGVPRYLDFACGTGRITCLLEEYAEYSFGIDLSETMLAEARNKCKKTTFSVQDLTQKPLSEDSFDLVTAFRFFGNAQDELRQAALKAIARLVKPGGYLILNNHRNPRSFHSQLLRLRGDEVPGTLEPSNLQLMLEDNGFRIYKNHGIGAWLIMYRLFSKKILFSTFAKYFEFSSKLPGIYSRCPDAVIIAQRT